MNCIHAKVASLLLSIYQIKHSDSFTVPFTAIYWLSPVLGELVFKLFVQEIILKLISYASALQEQS